VTIHFRKGTSDERTLKDVLERRCYRKTSIGFDVEKGEHWLDLGAHIGAFALYCVQRGATAECYEPDKESFLLLKKNVPQFRCHNVAVSASHKTHLSWYKPYSSMKRASLDKGGYVGRSLIDQHWVWRAGKFKTLAQRPGEPVGTVRNLYAGQLLNKSFDGVKIDIEGGEGCLFDHWLIPQCKKLVCEYHPSRDPSVRHLSRRLQQIHKHFSHWSYPPSYDQMAESGHKTINSLPLILYSRLIFAWND
jgi:FkbM family methyltransferase